MWQQRVNEGIWHGKRLSSLSPWELKGAVAKFYNSPLLLTMITAT